MITIEQLQQDIVNDPALEQQFAACTSPEQAVALAAERGYTLDAEEVARAFAAPPLTPLSDEELAAIGGGTPGRGTLKNLMSQNTMRRRSVRK